MSDLVVSQSIQYKEKEVLQPKYQLSQITQQTGGTTKSLTTSSNPESVFEIPAKVINFSRSILSFKVAPANEPTGTPDYARFLYADNIPFISNISLYTRTGVFLCDIPNIEKYTNLIFRRSNRVEDVETWDTPTTAPAYVDSSGAFEGLYMPKTLVTQPASTPERPDSNPLKRIGEPAYFHGSTVKPALLEPWLNVRINLGMIKDTILSLDKGQYFGETVLLRVVYNQTTKIAWKSTDKADCIAGASGPVIMDKGITLSSLYFFACFEQNQNVIDDLVQKFNAGTLTYLVPYVVSHRQLLETGAQTLSVRYSPAQGKKIKKILVAPYNTQDHTNTVNDHSNLNGSIVSSYHTVLNNVRTSQYNYDCTNGQDYMAFRHLVRGSCINSQDTYYYNWCHEENFEVNAPVGTNRDNHDDGLLLDQEIKFDMIMETTANKNYFVFAVLQRKINVSSNGVVFL